MSTYLYDQTWHQERDRIQSLEDLFDTATTRHLADLGVGEGWGCLEVRCGAGSIAHWLADRVGPAGRVVATDIDTRFVDGHGKENLEVRRHDLLNDPLEPDTFDLAHVRALLEHLAERERALRALVAAVRPGGWIVVEDIDVGDITTSVITRYVDPPEEADVFERLVRGIEAFVMRAGSDTTFGRRLPRALKDAGLINVGAELHAPLAHGGMQRSFSGLTLKQLRTQVVSAGLISDKDAERFLALGGQPEFRYVPMMMVTAWGQRAAGGTLSVATDRQ